MKLLLTALGLVAILTLGWSQPGGLAASSPASSSMSVKVLRVTPHTVTKKGQLIMVQVRYTGIRMDPLDIGRKPVAGHGHMQIYLDRIPAAAYHLPLVNDVIATATTTTFILSLTTRWRKGARGHHNFLIALARNDYVLYKAKPASFTLTVK